MQSENSYGTPMTADDKSAADAIVPRNVLCEWCQRPTLDVVNRQCWRCLHLSTRIARDLPLARRMVAALSRPRAVEG